MTASVRASITMTVLYFVYWAYVVIVSPLTEPEVREHAPSAIARADTPLPADTVLVAREYLPMEPWAAEAKFQPHLEDEGYVYFEDYFQIGDDGRKRVRIKPFALVWFDPRRDDRVPYSLTCDAAIIEFEKKIDLDLADSQDNRIVGGEFTGEVRITGPDGLEVEGSNITLTEGDGQGGSLVSFWPLRFAYGPTAERPAQVRGRADQFEITLTSGEESILGQDMPRISGIERIVLRFNVALDLTLEEDGQLVPISVRSDDRFEYDVAGLLATFDKNVHVSRPTHEPGHPEQYEQLHCDHLALTFEPKQPEQSELARLDADAGSAIRPVAGTSVAARERHPGIDLNMDLRSVWAVGNDVVLTSDEHELRCRMEDLRYDLLTRTVHMLDDEHVEVHAGTTHLACPDIRFVHDEESRVRSAQCTGTGWVWNTDRETGERLVEASWNERLKLSEDAASALDLLELHGDARVVQRQQNVWIVGDILRIWFDSRQMQASGARLDQSLTSRLPEGGFPLRRVVAERTGDAPVTMGSPMVHVETARVDARFTEATAVHPLVDRPDQRNPISRPDHRSGSEEPIRVSAGDVQAAILVDPQSGKLDIAELAATTDVRIVRAAEENAPADRENAFEGPFAVECERLGLRNDAEGQVLRLQGTPAFIRLADAETELEGNDILFHRTRNEARVTGPGTISMHMDHDFQGRPLEAHERLKVLWQDQMWFDGRVATFLGKTETRLADSRMSCHRMDVTLNRHISFTEDAPETDHVKIARIHCQDGVAVEYHEWEERSKLVGFLKMEVADFQFDQTTGDFTALGPGKINDWQRSNGRRRFPLASSNESPANRPVKPDELAWNYTWLKFSGELRGNQVDQYAVLTDRVQAIHGPVERPLQVIQREDLDAETETARNSVWLQSDQMNLQLSPGETADADDWLEVVAFGNAELEGKVFRARADAIKFDESKGLFSLKGKGIAKAGIWYQKAPGEPSQDLQAETVNAIPSKNLYWIGGTSGIRFTPP